MVGDACRQASPQMEADMLGAKKGPRTLGGIRSPKTVHVRMNPSTSVSAQARVCSIGSPLR
jgi:hypothetical protein